METDLTDALLDALAMDGHNPAITEQVSHTEIGANVAWFSGSRSNDIVLFINQLKGARPWSDPANTGDMQFDENGYPLSVPENHVVSKLLIRSQDVADIPPHTGAFRLYGVGSGTFSLTSTAQGRLVGRADSRRLPTETIAGVEHWYVDIDFSVGDEDIGQLILHTHTLRAGDHIRSLALVHHSHLENHRNGEVFAPELIDDLSNYETLRLMDWMRANRIEEDGDGWREQGSNWTSPNPEQRYVGTDFYTFNNHAGGPKNEGRFEVSVPIEHIVELANATDADPWITLPVDISDHRTEELAQYVATHLDDELVARWEYGNELFNVAVGFEGFRYSERMALETFGDFGEEGPWAAVEWAAYRGPQLYEIIGETFENEGRDARFIAPGWAFSGSLQSNGNLSNGYLVRYIRAAQSQALNDGTPLPLDVVTDYSVAMYFGGTLASGRPDVSVVEHIVATVDEDPDTQAHILADWLLFGVGNGPFYEISTSHVSRPLEAISWSADVDIGVTQLIWDDIQAGLDPLTQLPDVLRLNGPQLQYKGVNASEWTDVLVFDQTPDVNLQDMIDRVQLVGYGGRLFGETFTGLRSSLAMNIRLRLDAHSDYAQALGLNFVAYEGGSHVSYPPEGAFELYDAFNTGTANARVFARWLQIMSAKGLDEYMHFMSHNRTNGNDWWGVQDHIGQDLNTSPEGLILQHAAQNYAPNPSNAFTGPLRRVESLTVTSTGGLQAELPVQWRETDAWNISQTGDAEEANGTSEQLQLVENLPVQPGQHYQFTFDVKLDGADETELRFVSRGRSNAGGNILREQAIVQDGDHVVFEIGVIPEGQTSVMLGLQRVGRTRAGTLTVSNPDLITPAQ